MPETIFKSSGADFVISSFNGRSYIVYMFFMGLVVPLSVVIASYVCILRVLYKVNLDY